MAFFWQKQPEDNLPLTLLGRFSKIEARLTRLEAEILDVATAQDIIRNKVLRKIQPKKYPDEEEEDKKPKDLYNSVLLPEK